MDSHLRPKRHARVRASGNGHADTGRADAKTSTSISELAAEVVDQAETAGEHDHADTGSLDMAIMEILDQLPASDDGDADDAQSRCSTVSHKVESEHGRSSGDCSTAQKAQSAVSKGPRRIAVVEKYLASLDQVDVEVSRSAGHDDPDTDSDDDGQTRYFTPEVG